MLDLKNLPAPTAPAASAPVSTTSILAGLNKAPTFEQGTYFSEPGNYNCTIERCLMKRSGKTGAPVYIMEFTIKDILVPSPMVPTVVNGEHRMVPNPAAPTVGSKRSFVQKLTDINVAFPTLKAFALAALAPSTPEERAQAETSCEAVLEKAASDEQILKGTVINVNVVPKTTKAGILIHIPVFKPAT